MSNITANYPTNWFKRELFDYCTTISTQRPALVLTGCRQSGKTSLLKNGFPNAQYVTLDLPKIAQEAEESGNFFLSQHPDPVIIDEIQYAPQLLRYIKAKIDEERTRNGRFFLTGSQKFSLMQGVSESLAGRAAILTLHTLSAREIESHKDKPMTEQELLDLIVTGGYPEIHSQQIDAQRFYSDYVVTYLERDVRQMLNVKNLRDFDKFMRLCALRTGQLLSYHDLAADVGVSPNTIKAWIALLETSNIIFLLQPFFQNRSKRLIKTPKLYFLDTGLANFLCGMDSAKTLKASPLMGAIFETHVLGQVLRHFDNRGQKPQLSFFRDHDGNEVDLILQQGNTYKMIECKLNGQLTNQKGFDAFAQLTGKNHALNKTVIGLERGQHKTAELNLEDSVGLGFLE